jgi:membrane protein implicated in regulation of membrane protease activity
MNVELWLVWVVLGFVLVIAELLTGTFYLLVIGIGAFAAAVVAWLGGNELVQAVVGGVVALGGTVYVHRSRHAGRADLNREEGMLDRGQPVVLEGWANEAAGLARVRYRGTSWDARIANGEAHPVPGATLYIASQEGNTLVLVAAPPAR